MKVVEIRKIADINELEGIVEVEKSAWNMPDYREAVPVHMLRALKDNGGLILGAFSNGNLIGFSFGWIVGCGSSAYFYSHMSGVRHSHKYKNIGFRLKLKQREEVLKMGIKLIKWTFDPLQALNLNFNLEKLGVIARNYKKNYYGNIRDSINRGLDSDRVEAEWYLDSNHVIRRIEGIDKTPPPNELVKNGGRIVIDRQLKFGMEVPVKKDFAIDVKTILIAIPKEISSIRNASIDIARAWRQYTREAYEFYLGKGYILSGFSKDEEGNGYAILFHSNLNDILGG
ncbi:MAG: hypothetical protein G5Z42_03980 [Caldisphaeraceae archaeon]|nr:hypothetical protein [Caldisphaeraceae archaeon]MEB3692181.1 hypothetical protein [Caldisphaeraceae archaeon]MEB3797964.1 hypothetical protein [Caldisphaeraceae archaeon]